MTCLLVMAALLGSVSYLVAGCAGPGPPRWSWRGPVRVGAVWRWRRRQSLPAGAGAATSCWQCGQTRASGMMSSAQWGQETRPWDRAALAISFCLGVAMARMSTPRIPRIAQRTNAPLGSPRLFFHRVMPMNAAMRCSMMMTSARNQPVMLTVVAGMSFTLLTAGWLMMYRDCLPALGGQKTASQSPEVRVAGSPAARLRDVA